jgi:hypothetical protein
MSDWMDDLLSDLPSAPTPARLAWRLRARVALERRRIRAVRWAGRIALVGAAAGGLWMMAPSLARLDALVPRYSVRALGAWAALSLESPPEALGQAADSLLAWGAGAAQGLGAGPILALVLITIPALWGLVGLTREGRRQEEGQT